MNSTESNDDEWWNKIVRKWIQHKRSKVNFGNFLKFDQVALQLCRESIRTCIRTYSYIHCVACNTDKLNITYKASLLSPGYFTRKLNVEDPFHLPREYYESHLIDCQLFLLWHRVLYVESKIVTYVLTCRPCDCKRTKRAVSKLSSKDSLLGSGSCRSSKNFGGHSTLSRNKYGKSTVQLYMLQTVGPHPSSWNASSRATMASWNALNTGILWRLKWLLSFLCRILCSLGCMC